MNKLVITFFALAFMPISAFSQPPSQSKCGLTEANSPTVRGLRLGMSAQQLLALFPSAGKRKEMKEPLEKVKKATDKEVVYIGFEPLSDASGDQFAGVQSVSAGVFKGRVTDLDITYVGATWRSIDEWVAKLSETLRLPGAQDWVNGPSENPNKVLKCDGIEIEAAIQGGGASIRIRNTEYLKGMEERTNAGEEKKRREFKP